MRYGGVVMRSLVHHFVCLTFREERTKFSYFCLTMENKLVHRYRLKMRYHINIQVTI